MKEYSLYRETTLSFEEADQRIREALKEEGFGVLTEIDVRATLKQKLGVEFPRYTILGACNPPLAHRALQAEASVGVLLPCNVVVREAGANRTIIEALDPVVQMQVSGNPDLAEVAGEVRERVERALDRVAEG